MMKGNSCNYGLYPCCTKGLEASDVKVCTDCITNTVTHVLRATYHAPNNGGVTAAVKHLLER